MYYGHRDNNPEEQVCSLHIHRDAAIRTAKKNITKAKTEASQSVSIYLDTERPDDTHSNVVFSYSEASEKMIYNYNINRPYMVFSVEEVEVDEEE